MLPKVLELRDKNVVLALGSTGSGKSTLLGALVGGPGSLCLKQVNLNVLERANGTYRNKSIKVIDYRCSN